MKCNSSFLKRFSFIELLLENLSRCLIACKMLSKHKMASLLQLLLCLIHYKQDGVENKSGSTEKSQNCFQNDGILFLAHKIGNYLLSQWYEIFESEQHFLSNRKTDIKKYSRNESTKWKTLLRKYKIKIQMQRRTCENHHHHYE
ncbi:hypothetical protein T07_9063 [Trichinella nelsoni]|uniref:Uncharacterized protein n=1 Tax=Trichinella nelsoni TaxID=6336 RepID=A0A0V0RNG6_9BILA|nr:hypothetical protein T07_9063 [Trichinella nelsoni]